MTTQNIREKIEGMRSKSRTDIHDNPTPAEAWVRGKVCGKNEVVDAVLPLLEKLERETEQRVRQEIMEGAKQNNMTEPAFATFYGMKVMKSSMIPKGEIWMEGDNSIPRDEMNIKPRQIRITPNPKTP